jgi:hypothetical protein
LTHLILARRRCDTAVKDIFAEPNPIKRDEIAGRQAWLFSQHLGPRDNPLKLREVKGMFVQMRDHLP